MSFCATDTLILNVVVSYFWRLNSFLIQTNYTASKNSMLHVVTRNAKNMINKKQHINYEEIAQK